METTIAVAAECRQRPAVDLDGHLEHPLASRLLDADLVEGPARVRLRALLVDRHGEGHPLLDLVGPADDVVDRRRRVLALGLGEEADVAEVDAEQRHAGSPRVLGAAQDRAVATEDDDELAALGRVVGVGLDDRSDVDGSEHPRLVGRERHLDVGGAQPLDDATRDVDDLGSGRVCHEQDPAGHGAPVTRRFGGPPRRRSARRALRRDVSSPRVGTPGSPSCPGWDLVRAPRGRGRRSGPPRGRPRAPARARGAT